MTEDEARKQIAEVIERFNGLELRIADVLSRCVTPVTSDYGFLRELIFHNTLLSFGAKVQLLDRILDYWSWDDLKHTGMLKELMKLRNAFAHTPTAKQQLLVYFAPDAEYGVPMGSEFIIEKKTSTSWENVEREKAFSDFLTLYKKCQELVEQINNKVKESIAQQQNLPDKK
jgi:hypothetical protein